MGSLLSIITTEELDAIGVIDIDDEVLYDMLESPVHSASPIDTEVP